jgi:glycosyltransferase involved in cell wall biosynthesis
MSTLETDTFVMERRYDIGFFSSADRGLDVLLELIPKIEEKLGRKVTSCWAYGWNTYDQFHAQNPDKMKWKWQVIRAMNEVGMDAKGRLSHDELSDLMRDTDVWAYPTSFPEIHCITALKAQAAGCRPVTSGYAALQETVFYDEEDIELIHEKPDKLEEFVDRVVKTLQTPRDEEALAKHAEMVKAKTSWKQVAKVWDEALA